jgi:hypothetical protein
MSQETIEKPRRRHRADSRRKETEPAGAPYRPGSSHDNPGEAESRPDRAANPDGGAGETQLEAARRGVRERELLVDQQRELIFQLRRNGVSTLDAESTLRTMHHELFEQRKHLALLENRYRRGV